MHDEGTGGNTAGGYGFFPLFPLLNCDLTSCPVGLSAREAKRAAGTDGTTPISIQTKHWYSDMKFTVAASPGYFTTTFVNGIKLEATSTRRAGLIRFTYPTSANSTHVVIDLTHDLQRSFEGGSLLLNASIGRIKLSGTFLQVRIISHFYCIDAANPTYICRVMGLTTILYMLAMTLTHLPQSIVTPWLNLAPFSLPTLLLRIPSISLRAWTLSHFPSQLLRPQSKPAHSFSSPPIHHLMPCCRGLACRLSPSIRPVRTQRKRSPTGTGTPSKMRQFRNGRTSWSGFRSTQPKKMTRLSSFFTLLYDLHELS